MTRSTAIPAFAQSVEFSGLGLPAAPSRIICNVRRPATDATVLGASVVDTITADGFSVDLTGHTEVPGYVLDWMAIFE